MGRSAWPVEIAISTHLAANVLANGPSTVDCHNLANGVPTVNQDAVYLTGPTARKRIDAKSNSVIRWMLPNATKDLAQLPIVINVKIWDDACGPVR